MKLAKLFNKPRKLKCRTPKGRRWNKNDLTYSLLGRIPKAFSSKKQVLKNLARIFQMIEQNGDIGFTYIPEDETADIRIRFSPFKGEPFDGPDGILAYAFFPCPHKKHMESGDIFFDPSEKWTVSRVAAFFGRGIHFQTIALHEAFHAVGVQHIKNKTSIMYPEYRGPSTKLKKIDRRQIGLRYPKHKCKHENH